MKNNPLVSRLIDVFDNDGSGDVDFKEFIAGISTFSSKGNPQEKLKFAFKIYDIDQDGYISHGELFIVLKMMVGANLTGMATLACYSYSSLDAQLQQLVDKTIMEADTNGDGKVDFQEFAVMVQNTDIAKGFTLASDKV